MNFSAAMPDTTASFFLMFLSIAACRGARSASTKLDASDCVSIPEPAPNLLVTFAFDLLAVGRVTTGLEPEVTEEVVAMADL